MSDTLKQMSAKEKEINDDVSSLGKKLGVRMPSLCYVFGYKRGCQLIDIIVIVSVS